MTVPRTAVRTGPLLALLAFGQFIVAIDYNIVYVALPALGEELGFSEASLQWVVSAYAVAFGGLLLFGGRAADLLGRRRMLALALCLYGCGSLAGGLAAGQEVLLAARAAQGVGGALLVPATLSLIGTSFAEGAARNRALAVWGAAGAGGLALGALLGGVLTDALGWEAVFLVNVPLAALALAAVPAVVPAAGPRDRSRGLDVPGALTATVAITAIVFGLAEGPASGWTSPLVLFGLVGGALLLGLFVTIEARTAEPLLPLRLFGNRTLVTAMAITFVFMGTFGTQYYLFTVYLQDALQYGPLAAGLAFVPAAVIGAAGSKLSETLLRRIRLRATLVAGMLTGAVGMAAFALGMSADGSYARLLPGIALISVGQGVVWTSGFVAAATGVGPQEQGIASAMASTTQQIGAAVGLAVLVAVANSTRSAGSGTPEVVDGLQRAGWAAAVLTVLGAALAASLRPAPVADLTAVPAGERIADTTPVGP